RNSLAGVRDSNDRGTLLTLQRNAHFAALFVVMNGVGEQVGENLRKPLGVARIFKRREFAGNFYFAFVRERLDEFDAITNRVRQIKTTSPHGFLTGIESSEFEERFEQSPHPLRGALTSLDRRAIFGSVAFVFERSLSLREDHGDGS